MTCIETDYQQLDVMSHQDPIIDFVVGDSPAEVIAVANVRMSQGWSPLGGVIPYTATETVLDDKGKPILIAVDKYGLTMIK